MWLDVVAGHRARCGGEGGRSKMVQVVFVHGVTVRKIDGDPTYDREVAARDRRFAETAFGGNATIRNPYWGTFGARPITCIPKFEGRYASLSLDMARAKTLLLEAARSDFPAVVASLSVASLEETAGDPVRLMQEERVWGGAAAYALDRPRPPWLDEIATDDEFFAKLREEAVATAEAAGGGKVDLGIVDDLKKTASKLAGGLSNLANSPFGKVGREALSPKIAIFVGDVFRYLKAGDLRSNIRAAVLTDVETAARDARARGEKLVLVGHSMGAVILYDLLSDTNAMRKLSDALGWTFEADLFLSVGSQVAVFEETKVFEASDPAAGAPTPKPGAAKLWWNVFDKMDVLSFLAEGVFKDVEDFQLDTIAGVKDAHGAYFQSMVFYQRLNRRLKQEGLV